MATTRRDLQSRIVKKAMTDSDFKERLIASPKTAISEFIGAQLPANVTINVVQETSTQLYLVLPAPPPEGSTFSDEHLESFATAHKNTGATAIQLGICC